MFPEAKITWISPKISKPTTTRKILVAFRNPILNEDWVDESRFYKDIDGFVCNHPIGNDEDIILIAWAEWPEVPVTNA